MLDSSEELFLFAPCVLLFFYFVFGMYEKYRRYPARMSFMKVCIGVEVILFFVGVRTLCQNINIQNTLTKPVRQVNQLQPTPKQKNKSDVKNLSIVTPLSFSARCIAKLLIALRALLIVIPPVFRQEP